MTQTIAGDRRTVQTRFLEQAARPLRIGLDPLARLEPIGQSDARGSEAALARLLERPRGPRRIGICESLPMHRGDTAAPRRHRRRRLDGYVRLWACRHGCRLDGGSGVGRACAREQTQKAERADPHRRIVRECLGGREEPRIR